MTSVNEDTPKKIKSKKDPSRFLPPGLYFRGKFIGIEHVADACGDRSDMMCQVAMAKMKAAIKTLGDHKRKIIMNVSINGIKILDEKDEDVIFDHPLSRISYISRDISDSRAFGYVFNPGLDCHEFYGIKTEKAADVVVSSLRDLFCFVYTSSDLNKEVSHQEQALRMPSPPYSLKYGGFTETGTLGRFKKSPHLLYRFYNTVSNTPVPSVGSPRKAGFLTSYNRQCSVPITSPNISTTQNLETSSTNPVKTPSLSSSSSSNQNVNNSPSMSALKSPISIIASKKSLSSISSLPVIESPPNSPPSSRMTTMVEATTGGGDDDDHSWSKSLEEKKVNSSEEDKHERRTSSADVLPDSSRSAHVVENLETSNQSIWANFDEFDFSDDSPVNMESKTMEEISSKKCQSDSKHNLSEEGEPPLLRNQLTSVSRSHLALSFNGVDPFADDPFFSKNVGVSFDVFQTDDSSEFQSIASKQQNQVAWTDCFEDVSRLQEVIAVVEDSVFTGVDCQVNQQQDGGFKDKCFEDNFDPEMVNAVSNGEVLQAKSDLTTQNMNFDEKQLLCNSPIDQPEEFKAQFIHASPEMQKVILPSSLRPIAILKLNDLSDSLPMSPSTNPSEFPSPDIPPPPLPPEVTSPLYPMPPPLPPRRPQSQKNTLNSTKEGNIKLTRSEPTSPSMSGLGKITREEYEDAIMSQKLDTASILKLYTVPVTSYFCTSNVLPVTAEEASDIYDEPSRCNTKSVAIEEKIQKNDDDHNCHLENHQSRTSPSKPASLVLPGIPDRKSSSVSLSFRSYSSSDRDSKHNSENGNVEQECFSHDNKFKL